jgi:hypothetical protein
MFQVAIEIMETALGAKCKGGKALAAVDWLRMEREW